MSHVETLSPLAHRTMGIKTEYFPQLGYDMGAVMVLPNELSLVQKEYPIIFRRHAGTGRLFPTALLGFEQNENLFINEHGQWNAHYIPMVIRKGPFLIGFHNDDPATKPVILVDRDDPRVQKDGATRLFIGNGRPSEYLQTISRLLVEMHQGAGQLPELLDALEQCQLIEPLQLELEFVDGKKLAFHGAFTVSEQRLQALSADRLQLLAEKGFLTCAVSIANSLSNISALLGRKNERILKHARRHASV